MRDRIEFLAFSFRTHDGLEVDLVLVARGGLEVVATKPTGDPRPDDLARA